MTYELEFLPSANNDLCEIVNYISHKFANPSAAVRLAVEMIDEAEALSCFPYSGAVYTPIRPLRHSYRRIVVKNYLMFYYVGEPQRIITIARIVYACRTAIEQLLKGEILEGMQTPLEECLAEDKVQW